MFWNYLGFSNDLFFVDPLQTTDDDFKLFVGREQDSKRYLLDLFTGQRGLKIVTGDIGVGKTSFVNICQFRSYKNLPPADWKFELPKILPCFKKIQILAGDTPQALYPRLILVLCESIAEDCASNNKQIPDVVQDFLDLFLNVKRNTGGSGIGVSTPILGVDSGKGTFDWNNQLELTGRFHLARLLDSVRELGYGGVSILLNNLDILDRDSLISFMNFSRDELFDLPGFYWTLIGRRGIQSVIDTRAPRVGDYISGSELVLEPFGYDELNDILNRRVEVFRIDGNAKVPLDARSIMSFHGLSMRDSRLTFRICSEILKRALLANPNIRFVEHSEAMLRFGDYARERARELALTAGNRKLLGKLFTSPDSQWRIEDHQVFDYKSVSGFKAALRSLQDKRLLLGLERRDGTIYSLTGEALIAGISGDFGSSIQSTLEANLLKLKKGDHLLEFGKILTSDDDE